MANKKYNIIITKEYKDDMQNIKKIFPESYYKKLKEVSDIQIMNLERMPRMYQKLYIRNRLKRRIPKNSLEETYNYL